VLKVNSIRQRIRKLVAEVRGSDLKARVARGSFLLAAGTAIERVMRLCRNMILARLLAPDDFGLMALVLSVSVLLSCLTDVGVRQSIVHHQDGAKREYLNIAWWVQVARGIGLFITVLLVAPAICRFYDKPELLNLLRVSLAIVVLNALTSPRLYLLDKEFRFVKSLCLIQGSSLLGTLTAIILVLYMRNVWVLVIGQVMQSGVQCLLSHILCPFRPILKIDRRYLKEFLKFGRGMLGLAFLTVVSMQADVFVLAKILPSEPVGMYALALALARQPIFLFSSSVGRVLLPAFAEKQDDHGALCSAVIRLLRITLLFGVPLLVFAAIGAKPILFLVYGARYRAVAVPFALLCLAMLFYVQAIVLAQVYMAIGLPQLQRRYVILLAGLIISLMYPAVKFFGLTGAAGVLAFSHAVAVLMQVIWMKAAIGLKFREYISCWLPRGLGVSQRVRL